MPDHVKMTIIEPDGNEYSLWTLKGKTVWEALEIIGWDMRGSCGGQGNCSKCKFRMTGGISELSLTERERLIPEEVSSGQRLACYATVEDDFTLFIDYWQREDRAKNSLLRYHPGTKNDSGVSCKEFFIPGRETESHAPIYDRIKSSLSGYSLELSADNIDYLAGLDRQGRPALELYAIVLGGTRVIKVGRQREKLLGLALDIGSTSLFAALVDLENGKTVAMASHNNMQRIYGEDIVSRVSYAMEHEGGALSLQRILINNLNSMIEEMAAETGGSPSNIYKITAVGNPVMLHLFLGLSTAGFGAAPYAGSFSEDIHMPVSELGLKVNPLGKLSILPQLGGFVGADTTACLLTLAPIHAQTFLLIDIGTNGEIVLGHRGRMWAASAAAGPAFEGGAVSYGMRAGQGAIDKIFWDRGKLGFRVIGEGMPRGICGSGIIDLISVLLKNRFIDLNGTFTAQAARHFNLRSGDRGAEIVLDGGELVSTSPLVFNQEDIRQVQLARSAIRTAIDILLRTADVDAARLDYIFLAGAFGSYVDPESIINIGLIPAIDPEKISNIGNAAAVGTIIALLSNEKFQEASVIKSKVQYVELTEQEDFQNRFLKNLNFQGGDLL